MSIHERRSSVGWTQEQLAQHSGLSVRTIQRIENGQTATLETLKCLAAVFETNVSTLMQEQTMTNSQPDQSHSKPTAMETREKQAIEYVEHLKGFYMHGILYLVIMPCLAILNLVISPDKWWVLMVAVAWLFGIGIHAAVMFTTFNLFGAEWEQRHFKRRMGTLDE